MDAREATTKGGDQGQQTIESEQHGAEQAQRDGIDDALRAAYEEISRSHLAITDFRGKLLGLLPLATGVGIFLLLDNKLDFRCFRRARSADIASEACWRTG
jgi:hypothetical protein